MIATSTNGTATTMEETQPMSRTFQYRKVMKPMLERKRRARINRCLDELKELMVTALQSEGENVSKLEKADILELTVRHLHKLRQQKRLTCNPVVEADRFRAGYTHCANEVSRCLASTPGMDVHLGTRLMTHLGHRLIEMDKRTPLVVSVNNTNNNNSNNNSTTINPHQMHHHNHHHQHYTPPGSPNLDDPMPTSTISSSSSSTTSGYALPLTPASSPSSFSSITSTTRHSTPSPAPQPIDCSSTTGLLKVAVTQDEKVWRPW